MFDRVIYKENARHVYKGNVWLCVIAAGIYELMYMVFGGNNNTGIDITTSTTNGTSLSANIAGIPVLNEFMLVGLSLSVVLLTLITVAVSIFVTLFVLNMLEIGVAKFFIEARKGNYDINNVIYPYKTGNLKNLVIVMLIRDLKCALYTLFFIVPGIIKGYELYFVPQLLAEDPTLTWQEAHELSSQMTYGYKMDLFMMNLSFFGWHLLDSFTLGIGKFFTAPYYNATDAEAFAALKYFYRETSYDNFEV